MSDVPEKKTPGAGPDLVTEVERFADLFAGGDAHGTHGEPDWDEDKRKWAIKRTARTIQELATLDHFAQHLAGERPLGVVPIREDSTCLWGCGDIDDYELDVLPLIGRIEQLKYPLVPCRSKSGGLHLFLFLLSPEPAGAVQVTLRNLMTSLGHATAEVFPKQVQLVRNAEREDQGNWIIIPYFGGDFGGKLQMQHGIKAAGGDMLLSEFLRAAEAARTTTAEVRVKRGKGKGNCVAGPRVEPRVPFGDGPPCLQRLVADGGVQRGGQNNALLMMGIYYKRADPDDWRAKLEAANQHFLAPPGSAEGLRSSIKSLEKKDYQYTCKIEPMCGACDSATCRRRKFGVGDAGNFPVIVGMRKVVSDEPTWFVRIEGSDPEMEFRKIGEMTDYRKFNDKCAETLNRFFQPMRQAAWATMINEALGNITEEVPPLDMTPAGKFRELLEDFLTNRSRGKRWEDLQGERPFQDVSRDNRHFFQMKGLDRFLERQGFCAKRTDIQKWIRGMGGGQHDPSPTTILRKSVRLWWVPDTAIEPAVKLELPRPKPEGI